MNGVQQQLWEEAVKTLRMLHDFGVNVAVVAVHDQDVRADIMLYQAVDKDAVLDEMISQLELVQGE